MFNKYLYLLMKNRLISLNFDRNFLSFLHLILKYNFIERLFECVFKDVT